MNSPSTPPPIHPTAALQLLSNLHLTDYDLLANEINGYAHAIRSRAGRTTFTAEEVRVLFNRMLDVMTLAPAVTANEPQDMDRLKSLQDVMNEPLPQITKRRV